MTMEHHPSNTSAVLFQCAYGQFRKPYLWLFASVGVVGVVAVPIGLFWNKGWQAGGHPVAPWAATVIIEIFAVGAIAIAAATCLASLRRGQTPQRVAITRSALIVPRGWFSDAEVTLPFAEIETKVFDVGFVKQLQIMHGRKKLCF